MPLTEVARHLNDSSFNRFVIEAGHIYLDSTASPLGSEDKRMGLRGAALGGQLAQKLGGQVSRWVFVDELHADTFLTVNPHRVSQEYARVGFTPDKLVLESDPQLHAEALDLVDKIRTFSPDLLMTMRQGYSLRTGDTMSNILLAERTKRDRTPVNPKCALLDAALTLQKIQGEGGVCVTVLPERYARQQESAQAILEACGLELPLVNVFFSAQGQVRWTSNF